MKIENVKVGETVYNSFRENSSGFALINFITILENDDKKLVLKRKQISYSSKTGKLKTREYKTPNIVLNMEPETDYEKDRVSNTLQGWNENLLDLQGLNRVLISLLFEKNFHYCYTLNLDQKRLYINDLWPEHILESHHIFNEGSEKTFIKLIFEKKYKVVGNNRS